MTTCTHTSYISLTQPYIYDGDMWVTNGAISPATAPTQYYYNDGTYQGNIPLVSTSDWYTNAPSVSGPYTGQTATGTGTGTAFYSGDLTATQPPTTTAGQVEIMTPGSTTLTARITQLEFGSGYSTLTITVNGVTKSVTPTTNTGSYWISSTADFQGLSPSTNYTVTANMAYPGQTANSSSKSATTLAPIDHAPTVNIQSCILNSGNILLTWSATDDNGMRSTNTYALYITGPGNSTYTFKGYVSNTAQSTNISYTFTSDGTGAAFVTGQVYQVRVVGYDTSNQSDSSDSLITYSLSRPANFQWTYAKVSGADFNVKAAEWNALMDRINDFRDYKGVGRSTYSTAYVNSIFYYYQFNEAVNMIARMNSNVPFTVYTGDTIYASDLNQLRDSLNQIA